MKIKMTRSALVAALACLAACGGGGGSSPAPSPSPTASATPTPTPTPIVVPTPTPTVTPTPTIALTPTPTITPTPTTDQQSLSGTVTYDFVPHFQFGGLNYAGTSVEPVKGVVVELLSSEDLVLDSTISDSLGFYSFSVDENTEYRVRVLAQLERDVTPSWDVSVTDNTDGNALYAMEGELVSSGTKSSVRNLHAPSGWDELSSSYASERVAGPFAILDSVYQVLDTLHSEGFEQDFPATELRWSVNNRPSSGELVDGDISTSFFSPSLGVMYILGAEDIDTDEYDRSIVQHEFGHYLEDALSRSESIGGSHSLFDILDPRVAFSEGFANALTAAVSGTGIYEDSGGAEQSSFFNSFRFSLEQLVSNTPGWYSEDSVGNIVFDIMDDESEAGDNIDLGLADVINVMSSEGYRNHPAFTTIFLFLDQFRAGASDTVIAALDELAEDQLIFGTGAYGENETNDGGLDFSLPVYNELPSIGASINVCSLADEQDFYNYLGVRRYVRLNPVSSGSHTLEMTTTSNPTGRDLDAWLYIQGTPIALFDSAVRDSEVGSVFLQPTEYMLEVFDYDNSQESGAHAEVCFDVELREGN